MTAMHAETTHRAAPATPRSPGTTRRILSEIRGLIAIVLLAMAASIGVLPSSAASFTAAATAPDNTVDTATLAAPQLTATAVSSDSIDVAWTPAPAGGAEPTYTLVRGVAGADPQIVYSGSRNEYTDSGSVAPQPRPLRFTAVSGGYDHSLAIDEDGHAWSWGANDSGQLGDGSARLSRTPVRVHLPSEAVVIAVSAGEEHSLALDEDHNVWAWGANYSGQLGTDDGILVHRTPVNLSASTGVRAIAVAAGRLHSLAIDEDHNVWAWGDDRSGQLGNGDNPASRTPFNITPSSGLRATEIAAGTAHSLAIDEDHHVWSWGSNFNGALGIGPSGSPTSQTPLDVTATSGVRATAIAAGNHSLAIDEDRNLWAWGSNINGQLGDGSTSAATSPVNITTSSGLRATAIAASQYHSLAIDGDHDVWAWGSGILGQLGDGANGRRSSPVNISATSGVHAVAISAGLLHSLAVDDDQALQSWGANEFGALGNSTRNGSNTPTPVDTTTKLACPSGLILRDGGPLCSFAPGTIYEYTVTATIGGWHATSPAIPVTTTAPG